MGTGQETEVGAGGRWGLVFLLGFSVNLNPL